MKVHVKRQLDNLTKKNLERISSECVDVMIHDVAEPSVFKVVFEIGVYFLFNMLHQLISRALFIH